MLGILEREISIQKVFQRLGTFYGALAAAYQGRGKRDGRDACGLGVG